jgi:hypothetical protein
MKSKKLIKYNFKISNNLHLTTNMGAGAVQSIQRPDYGLDDWGFDSQQEQEIFLYSIKSRPALEPKQVPSSWIPGGGAAGA